MPRIRVALLVVLLVGQQALAQSQPPLKPAEQVLQAYVEDFRNDPAALAPITFGIRVQGEGGGDWHVIVTGKKVSANAAEVMLKQGLPPMPSALYMLDLATLHKIDRGELNALTALARARSSDPTPMDIKPMPGFDPDPSFFARFIPLTFHFWTRSFPETVRYGKPYSRLSHGGNVVIFYYQKGLRYGWAQLEKGQHANKDPKDAVNSFPSMFVGVRGRATAKIGGKEASLSAGEMLFVPAGVSHEFWNPFDEPAEFILLMFGEGA